MVAIVSIRILIVVKIIHGSYQLYEHQVKGSFDFMDKIELGCPSWSSQESSPMPSPNQQQLDDQ